MCEHFVARAGAPFALGDLWPFAERLERYGIAGFGWGVAWLDDEGTLRTHRSVDAFAHDPARHELAAVETSAVLVHLRRPSRLSTLTMADAQPFPDPAGRFAFSHNGDLRAVADDRRRFLAQDRIHGRADTEVGARWLEDQWGTASGPGLLVALHRRYGGQANLAVLAADGSVNHYAGNSENPVFSFRLGRLDVLSTGIYSLDRSMFRFVAPDATKRRLVRVGQTATLGPPARPDLVEGAGQAVSAEA